MLRQDVLDAAAAGTFHIYSVDNIDQALELFTGYSAKSIDDGVLARVEELQALSRSFSEKEGDKDRE
jgi:predicted ATP-dependent protease